MINKNFNKKVMEIKIEKNIKKGFSIKTVKIVLREEFINNRKSALTLDVRAEELRDQIEYIDKFHKD